MRGTGGVQAREQIFNAVGAGGDEVARLVLVLLVVDLLLEARARGRLGQLITGVDPPGRGQGGGQDGAQLEGRHLSIGHEGGEDVVGGRPECGAQDVGGVLGELDHVVDELLLGVAPREVGVGLVEADLAQGAHHGRPGECLGQEEHLGVGGTDLPDEALPEGQRLGVRVVHAEDRHAVTDPGAHDLQDRGVDALGVVVEVQGVDVLVLLGRILRIGDRAVGQDREPFGVLTDPRVVRRALEGQVQGDLHAELTGTGHQGVEVVEGAQIGVDDIVPAIGRADAVGRARVIRTRIEGVVAALAVGGADGGDRGEVEDVEPHGGDAVEPFGGGAQSAGVPVALLIGAAAE